MLTKNSLTVLVVAHADEPLAAMLSHHRRLADEFVVVETGDDPAVATAAECGALAVTSPWDDDFSAPRNAGIARAGGDWILVLGTDELVAPGDFDRLRRAVAGPPAVRSLTTVCYHPDPRFPEWRPVSGRYPLQERGQSGCFLMQQDRLFPRRDGLIFRGRSQPTLQPAAAALGLPVEPLDVPVHHYGFVLGPGYDAVRRARRGGAARRQLADHPDAAAAVLDLAWALIEEGDPAAAAPPLERLVRDAPAGEARNRSRYLLGRIRRTAGDLAGAAALLEAAVRDDPGLLFCWIEWSRVLADGGAWNECGRILSEARERIGDDPLLDKEELRCLLKTGRVRAAAALLERLRQDHPAWQDLQGLAARLGGKD